jgi:23S rRNA pseudouridine1911/1915/1917 synthase
MSQPGNRSLRVPASQAGERLDRLLVGLYAEVTRARLQAWIEGGYARVDGQSARKSDRLRQDQLIEVCPPPVPDEAPRAQAIPLEILYEDDSILVINKPPGLVVHPGAGNPEGTLFNALLHHGPRLSALPRAGIVHRLDKETSGLLVIAKTESARQNLVSQLKARTVTREYLAIVSGVIRLGGRVDAPIGRSRAQRTKMAVTRQGKEAVSHYRVLKNYRAHTLLQVRLESGRTHQIRVHMAHIRHPVLGDPVYGAGGAGGAGRGAPRVPRDASAALAAALAGFSRQALHALKLALEHPETGEKLQWTASVPADMAALMELLAKDARRSAARA